MIAKAPANAGGGAIVARRETRGWSVVPISVEREIPIELAPQLDVVRGIQIEVHSPRIRNGREQIGFHNERRPVEIE